MFGVLSQAILGFDWMELALRGVLLGCLLGAFHRWYVRHAARFEVTLLYVFVCVLSYSSVRAGTLYFLYPVIYRFLPFLALVWFGRVVLKGALRRHAWRRDRSAHLALHS
jgi:hypothetical protein